MEILGGVDRAAKTLAVITLLSATGCKTLDGINTANAKTDQPTAITPQVEGGGTSQVEDMGQDENGTHEFKVHANKDRDDASATVNFVTNINQKMKAIINRNDTVIVTPVLMENYRYNDMNSRKTAGDISPETDSFYYPITISQEQLASGHPIEVVLQPIESEVDTNTTRISIPYETIRGCGKGQKIKLMKEDPITKVRVELITFDPTDFTDLDMNCNATDTSTGVVDFYINSSTVVEGSTQEPSAIIIGTVTKIKNENGQKTQEKIDQAWAQKIIADSVNYGYAGKDNRTYIWSKNAEIKTWQYEPGGVSISQKQPTADQFTVNIRQATKKLEPGTYKVFAMVQMPDEGKLRKETCEFTIEDTDLFEKKIGHNLPGTKPNIKEWHSNNNIKCTLVGENGVVIGRYNNAVDKNTELSALGKKARGAYACHYSYVNNGEPIALFAAVEEVDQYGNIMIVHGSVPASAFLPEVSDKIKALFK